MIIKPKIHVFGDSFSVTFKQHKESNSSWFLDYYKVINEIPESYCELIANHYDYQLCNYSMGGCSNYTIFDTFLENYENISKNDLVIFGWTSINRFRIASQNNTFVDILPFTSVPKQNDDVNLQSTHEIAVNRDSYNIWWKEISNNIKVINKLLNGINTYHWTWSEPQTHIGDNIWSSEDIEMKRIMIADTWKNIDIDVKNAITRSCDYLFDLINPIDLNEIKSLVNQNKKIFLVNREICPLSIYGEINRNFNPKIYNTTNHKKECFKLMIPYFKYETIKDETKGNVKDIHYSRNGHKELSKTLIEIIGENKKPII